MPYKIFVPIDGSECAQRALQHAIGLATRLGDCSIHIAHAHEEPMIYGEIAVYVPREKIERLQREQSEGILASAESLLRTSGLPYTKEILVGPVAEMLTRQAASLGCDAIVMGTHGGTALGRLLLGSIATKVIHLSNIPVTLVK